MVARFAAAMFALLAAWPGAALACHVTDVADLPVQYSDAGIPVVTITLHGQPLRFEVDTGSDLTFITDAVYQRFNFDSNGSVVTESVGVGGTMQSFNRIMQTLIIGKVHMLDVVMNVGNFGADTARGAPVDGLLGENVLHYFDLALDLPHGMISLSTARGCDADDTTPPWPGDFAIIPFKPIGNGAAQFPILIDNQTLNAILDTGASNVFAEQRALNHVGVVPEAMPGGGTTSGIGGLKLAVREERFDSVVIGADVYADAPVTVGDSPEGDLPLADALVGEAYLRQHRVFISNATHTIYLGTGASTAASGQ